MTRGGDTVPKTSSTQRKGFFTKMVLLILGLLLLGGATVFFIIKRDLDNTFSCALPPSQQERLKQEAFVRAHLADAACSVSKEPDALAHDVLCKATGVDVSIRFESDGGLETAGELFLPV
jgi:hypothetical protein